MNVPENFHESDLRQTRPLSLASYAHIHGQGKKHAHTEAAADKPIDLLNGKAILWFTKGLII